MINNLNILLPEIFLTLSIFSILMIGVFLKNSFNLIFNLSSIIILITIIIIFNRPNIEEKIFLDSFTRDAFSNFFKILILISSLFVLNTSKNYITDKKLDKFEYPIIILLSILGMFFMVSSNDIIIFYLGLELQSLSLYILASIDRDNLKSSESGIKYFVLSIIASAIILFGFSYLYGISGSINILDITKYANNNEISNLYLFSYVLIFIGVAFKFAVAPFHMWLPDVYEGAPLPITNFIASIPKIAFFVFAFRFLNNNPIIDDENFSKLILFLGMFSIFIGNLFALAQKKIMRMLAYSGVANAGFIFIALFSALENNFSIAAFYVASYSITTVSAISIITFLSSKKFNLIYINDLKGLASKSGYIAILLMVTLLSTAGIPLTIGFYAKYLVLDALVDRNLILIAVIVVLMTVVGLYYYLRVIWFMFFEAGFNSLINTSGKFSIIILSLIPASILLIFLFPDLVFKYIFEILT